MGDAQLLKNKRVLVTGGSRGLGRAFCLVFAKHGADIALTYRAHAEHAEATAADCRALGARAMAIASDVREKSAVKSAVKAIEAEWGGIDVLVNNAGVSQVMPFALMGEKDWDRVIDTNLRGTYLVTRAVLRGMIRRKAGVIVNIGSLAGVRWITAPVHYSTSKAGVSGFTGSLAKEVGRHGIRVVCLAPGLLEGGVAMNLPEHRMEAYLSHCALARLGSFGEVAELGAFVASDRAGFLTGETIVVDGGV